MAVSTPALKLMACIVLSTIIATACGIFNSETNSSLEIKTDKNSYVVTQDEFISVTIKNTSEKTVYYSTCFEKRLEILDDNVKIDAIPFPVCECICAASLNPGESIPADVGRLNISNIHEDEKFQEGNNISYRLVYTLHEDEAWGDKPLPEKDRTSNQFRLLLPE